ncbi:MAG: molybdenum cofactor biosynthesis protein MoaE [Flavobacteriaceae bacterium]|nr:molybdenum cofactor biosynthesis protein MoaE [Flavobacteriaceae bacterium]
MKERTIRNVFHKGAISPDFVAESIAKHQSKTEIGAHDIFLGQVRADVIDEKQVVALNFTAYEEMANQKCHDVKEEAIEKFGLSCLHIHHSLGTVKTGEICIFVFVSAPHRKSVFEGLQWVVNSIKADIPIFGKEVLEDDSYQWKVNK